MGNSEVGHMNIGAGRIVDQDFTRINKAIEDGSFASRSTLTSAFSTLAKNGKTLHLFGLLSPGGVHSHESHITAMVNIVAAENTPCYLHAFLDGRDVPPRSAKASLEKLQRTFEHIDGGIASICGRYYAMDRDHRWERTELAYDLLTSGIAGYNTDTAINGLAEAYARGENDELFVGCGPPRRGRRNDGPLLESDEGVHRGAARDARHVAVDRWSWLVLAPPPTSRWFEGNWWSW